MDIQSEINNEVNNCIGKINESFQDVGVEMMETNCESNFSEDNLDNCRLPEHAHDYEHDYEHDYDHLFEIRIFIAGFRACVQETIRYLIEEEGLLINDPFMISLQQHLHMQETMYILQCLGSYTELPSSNN